MEDNKIEFKFGDKIVWMDRNDYACNRDFEMMKRGLMTREEFNTKWPTK